MASLTQTKNIINALSFSHNIPDFIILERTEQFSVIYS